jgi:S-adenosylmethionine decarboxylase
VALLLQQNCNDKALNKNMIKNLAPDIFRQRLLIESFYTIDISRETVEKYLLDIAENLSLRTYGKPVIFAPTSSMGQEKNAGYDAFIPLIDSGISAYFWSNAKFFSIVIYTCKGFDEQAAIDFTREYFAVSSEIASASF